MSLKPTPLSGALLGVDRDESFPARSFGVRLLTHRLFPGVIQAASLALFLFLIWQAVSGPPHGENNAATSLIWTIWWPLLPVLFFLFARGWCTFCPLGAASALIQSVFRGLRKRPSNSLRTVGPWFMAAAVLLIAVANLIWGLEEIPVRTGIFFGALLLASALTALVYEGRAWCRYLCPIGALSGLLSTFSIMELRPDLKACAGCASRTCNPALASGNLCPLYETPLRIGSNRNCNLCGNCAKSCSSNAFSLRWRNPFVELGAVTTATKAEFTMLMLFIGMTWFEAFRMTQPYRSVMKSIVVSGFAPGYGAALLVVFVIATAVLGGACLLLIKQSGVPWSINTLIPLALVGHISVGVYHLLTNGPRALAVGINSFSLPFLQFDLEPVVRNSVYTIDLPVKAFQIALLLCGMAAALYIGKRVYRDMPRGKGRRIPVWSPAAFVITLFLMVLALPAAMMH